MRRPVVVVGLCLLMASAGWAQDMCHWYGVTKGFYRVTGTYGSEIISIFAEDGAFVWTNDTHGGTGTVEFCMDMLTTNWIRQEHLQYTNLVAFQFVQVSNPSCVPQTGQSDTYADGDDGQLQKGHGWPPRFTVQADTNLVVDNLTGLMWIRNANGGSGTWDTGVDYFYNILDQYGYDDWRMPTIREMESLLDMGESNPALPLGHPFNNVQTNYWTSTADVVEPDKAWVISLSGGTIVKLARTNMLSGWPVRGDTSGPAPVPKTGQTNSVVAGDDGDLQPGQPWPVPRFTVMADTNLVFDNLVGRMWAREAFAGGIDTWSNALAFCNTFELGGYSDWRLPNRAEARSLVDYGSADYMPVGHPFDWEGIVTFWTSTTYDAAPTNAWVTFDGLAGSFMKSFPEGAVWPVRGDW